MKIDVINTTAGWAVIEKNNSGDRYIVCDPETRMRYTLAQAQCAAQNLRRHLAGGGESYANPIPAGVRVLPKK